MPTRARLTIGGITVRSGETRDVRLKVSESYTGDSVSLPIRVIRGRKRGPAVFVSATLHGDELNGMGMIHDLMFGEPLQLICGAVILVPVLNIFGFETQDRYMPDRRDLNRAFPGSKDGSLSSRVANMVFTEIIKRCDFGIDLHSAATPRTNFPNIRADLGDRQVRRLANAFGCEMVVNSKGPEKSLRREATKSGCPTITLEAGEPRKIEPAILEIGVKGVKNILKELKMLPGDVVPPSYQIRVNKALWVRAQAGGILRFHVAPGEPIDEGQAIATNVSVFGEEQNVIRSPADGIILGMTTLPTVKPGEPVCHIAIPTKSIQSIRKTLGQTSEDSLRHRLRTDLATNISVSECEGDWAAPIENGDA